MNQEIIKELGDFTIVKHPNIGLQYLCYRGQRIAEVRYCHIEKHQSIENWIKKVKKRDLDRVAKIEQEIELLQKEKESRLERWKI